VAEDEDLDLELAPEDAGTAFRAEMAATNFFMGYWKQLLAALIVGLLSIFLYGQYGNYVQNSQRTIAAHIADVERDLPTTLVGLAKQKAAGQFTATNEELVGAAAQLEAIASASSGTASIEARLKAAELYRLAGEQEKRRGVLEAASEASTGLLHFAAESALAAMELNADQGEAAVARYTTLASDTDAFLAQQATIELAAALHILGRKDDADKVYGDFMTRWPDAPRASEVASLRERMGSAG
jgi:hypothetical protein